MIYKESQYDIVIEESLDAVILYNSMTGAVSRINKAYYKNIIGGNPERTPFLHELLRQGHVVHTQIDEFQRYYCEHLAYIFDEPEKLQYVIVPSMACNCRCIYCFEGNRANDTATMTDDIANSIISFVSDQIDRHPEVKKIGITWFGGEPLLQIKRVESLSEQFLSICENKGISYSAFVITNGLLLDKRVADSLAKCKVSKIQITIDGDKTTYSRYKVVNQAAYDRIIENITYASNMFRVDVRMNVSMENQDEILSVAEKLMNNSNINQNLTVYAAQITDCQCEGCHSMSDEDFEKFRRMFDERLKSLRVANGSLTLKRRPAFCATVKKDYCVIGPDGHLYRCEHEVGNEAEVIGDVVNGFYRNHADMKYLRMQFDDECKKCAYLPLCAGGCPTNRLVYSCKPNCDVIRDKFNYRLKTEVLNNQHGQLITVR